MRIICRMFSIFLALLCSILVNSTRVDARVTILPPSFPVHLLQEPVQTNGEFIVQVSENRQWREVARLPMNKWSREQSVAIRRIENEEGTLRVKIKQNGGGGAYLDSVLLDGTGPWEIQGSPDPLAMKKISQKDFDLLDAGGREIDLTFYSDGQEGLLRLTGRIEALEISRTPLQFPLVNLHQPLTVRSQFLSYPLRSQEQPPSSANVFDWLSTAEPFHQAYSPTGSGHPAGVTFFWVRHDADHLYVAVDFTSDNTRDGDQDYAKVYIRNETVLQEFKVSEGENRWGKTAFTYTDKVPYQHKTYEFKIPLQEIGRTDGREAKELQLAFAAYGTVSAPGDYTPALAYDSVNQRFLIVYGKSYDPPGPELEDFEIFGRIVSKTGNVVVPDFPITNELASWQQYPAAAFDPTHNRYLVVWQDHRLGAVWEIFGQWVNATGTLEGLNFLLGNPGGEKLFPQVAYDPVNQRFLVVWNQRVGLKSYVYGRIINGDGSFLSGDFLIAGSSTCDRRYPQTAFDPASQRYLVVWDRQCGGVSTVGGRSIKADGLMPDLEFGIVAEVGENLRLPGIVQASSSQEFLVIWEKESSREIYGSLLNPLGTILKPKFPITSGAVAYGRPEVAYDHSKARHLVVWHGGPEISSTNILGQLLASDGTPQGSSIVIADQTSSLSSPVVAFNPFCSGFLVAYEVQDAVYHIGQNLTGGSTCANIYLPLVLKP
jgi:hypothetical protein